MFSGHPLEDLCVSLLVYPSVALQMEESTSPQSDTNKHKVGESRVNGAFSHSIDAVPAIVVNSKDTPYI